MGQYYKIYNVTKKEYISPHTFNDGVKLREFGYGGGEICTMQALALLLANSNGRGGGDFNIESCVYNKNTGKYELVVLPEDKKRAELLKEVAGRWAGDKIVVQGDYANKEDRAFISERRLKNFKDISDLCLEVLKLWSY
jgi:hypothetical protein